MSSVYTTRRNRLEKVWVFRKVNGNVCIPTSTSTSMGKVVGSKPRDFY